MEIFPGVWIAILCALWATDCINSLPSMDKIDCKIGSTRHLGEIDEGFKGDIETIHNVPPVQLVQLKLDTTPCPHCAPYLEFIANSSITPGTVRAKNPLDREALKETGVLQYRIICTTTGVVYDRRLIVRDLNDNAPVFEKKVYRVNVAMTSPVGTQVVQVRAMDADSMKDNNNITYSIQPPSNTFEVNSYGEIRLRELLNDSSVYKLTVKAEDPGGLFSESSVIVSTTNQLSPFQCSLQNEYLSHVIQGQDMLWWCRYVVVISLNQGCQTVRAKLCEMEKALANALSWTVHIIDVSLCRQGPTEENIAYIRLPQPQQVILRTNVSFIARFNDDGHKLISKETIQKKLRDDKNKVLERIRQVFGQHAQFNIIDEDNRSDKTSTIILGSLLALVCISAVIAVFLMRRKTKKHKLLPLNGANTWELARNARNKKSIDDKPNHGDRASIDDRPNLGDRASIDDRPNLGDRASIDDRPNLGNRASIDDRPNLGHRVSFDNRPNQGN